VEMSDRPLVSCIMPTAGRRRFVGRAIDYFRRQDYPNRELIIVDDGEDAVADLIPDDPMVRYQRLDRRLAVGTKRNVACEAASGTIVAHWDDDDWYAPHRLTDQVETLVASGADVCGLSSLVYYDPDRAKAWVYTYPSDAPPWLGGGTLCYRRAFWEGNRFADIDAGEDALFVWNSAARVIAMPDRSFYVATVHAGNVSPKATDGPWWAPLPVSEVRSIVDDPTFFAGDGFVHLPMSTAPSQVLATTSAPAGTVDAPPDARSAAPARNVYACLAHESPDCVIDLVRNLHHLDPDSPILLYNGGPDARLFDGFPLADHGAMVVPEAQPMAWGRLHDFALDSMRFALANMTFDTLTIVDSDQLAARPHYPAFIGDAIRGASAVGILANSVEVQPPTTTVGPAVAAHGEAELWRPFLRRFRNGEALFPQWCFWPATVFTRDASADLSKLFATDSELQRIMERTQIWASEEVILPTLVALLGYEIARNPCSDDFVKYRVPYTVDQIEEAIARPDVFWIHPVPRRYDDPLRILLRTRFDHYERPFPMVDPPAISSDRPDESSAGASPAGSTLLQALSILERMRTIDGWLADEEADLLIGSTVRLLAQPEPQAIVEIGSYCGRATVVLASVVKALRPTHRVHAIDAHDGIVGALDQGLVVGPATLEVIRRNLDRTGLADVVDVVALAPRDVAWDEPIGLLVVDGLHDYASVARDLFHFESSLRPGSLIAFHDYADYFPGVVTFVNECVRSGRYRTLSRAGTLYVVERTHVP
jgi:predicted O-methyltransferase YrrM